MQPAIWRSFARQEIPDFFFGHENFSSGFLRCTDMQNGKNPKIKVFSLINGKNVLILRKKRQEIPDARNKKRESAVLQPSVLGVIFGRFFVDWL